MAKKTTLGAAKHLSNRPLLLGDRLVGFWEYDPDAAAVVFSTFDEVPPAARTRIEQATSTLGALLRDEVGHARSFSLDTDDALRERAKLLRG